MCRSHSPAKAANNTSPANRFSEHISSLLKTAERVLRRADTMSAAPADPVVASGVSANPSNKVLPCVLCSQRKVKCDRQTPCSNCVKSRMACVPAAQVKKPRKRRFAERQLLDRLKSYEELLKQHGIAFPEPGTSTQREGGRGDSTALSTRPGTPDSFTSEEGTAK